MFIQLSQLTKWPLYVSPFFSSTNCNERLSWIINLEFFKYFFSKDIKQKSRTYHGVVLRRF